MFYFIEETFPEQIWAYDPDTMVLDTPTSAAVHGPRDVDGTSSHWYEGGCTLEDGYEYILSRNGTSDSATALWRKYPEDLVAASSEIDTTQSFIRGSRSTIGGQAFCAAPDTGLLYAYAATGREQGYFAWEHDLDDLKIVEFQPDGTIVRTFDFPAPSSAEAARGLTTVPHNLYAGEDSVNIPSMAITPDGSTLYVVASHPDNRTPIGDDAWWTTIFKFDIASGVGIRWKVDQDGDNYSEPGGDLTFELWDWIATNYPAEQSPSTYYIYGISGLACFPNGDLLVASAYSPTMVRLDPDGNIVQFYPMLNAPSYTEDPPGTSQWASTGYFYEGLGPIAIVEGWIVVAKASGTEFWIDDGTGTYTGVTIWSGDLWGMILVDGSQDPATHPVVLLPITGPPYLSTDERPFAMWAPRSSSTPPPPPPVSNEKWGQLQI